MTNGGCWICFFQRSLYHLIVHRSKSEVVAQPFKEDDIYHPILHIRIVYSIYNLYHDAFLTPGICPARALSLNAVLFNLKSVITDLEWPEATHLSLICVYDVYLGMAVSCNCASNLALAGSSVFLAMYFNAFLVTSCSANCVLLNWSLITLPFKYECLGSSNFTGNLKGMVNFTMED